MTGGRTWRRTPIRQQKRTPPNNQGGVGRQQQQHSKYLGVTISDNLYWSKHITTTTTKANARLSFIKRNLKDCPQQLKEIAYFSLVRSFVDYASAVWDPHQKFNQVKLEMVQRRAAARFVKSRYKRTDSVTAMLDELGWAILSKRRKDARLILFLQNY